MKRFSLFLATLIITVFLWDLLFSSFIYNIPERYYKDSTVEWIAKPHQVVVQSDEGYGRDMYNNISALGPDIVVPKRNVFRILVFGDSHTQAFQVMPRQKYTNILAERLSNLARKLHKPYKIEIINLGVNGFSIADYIYYLDYYIEHLQPDYLIFQVNHDDFIQALQQRAKYCYVEVANKGIVLKKDTHKENFLALFLERHGLYDSFARLQGKSSTIDYLIKAVLPNILTLLRDFNLKTVLQPPIIINTQPAQVNNAPAPDIKTLVGESIERITDDSGNLKNTDTIADWFFSEVQRRKIPSTVLMLSYYPTKSANSVILSNLMETRRLDIISRQAARHDITAINMNNDFLQFYQLTQKFPRGFYNTPLSIGHLNTDGHRLTANKLFDNTEGFLP